MLPITRHFHPVPTLHFTALHFTSLHFYARLDDFDARLDDFDARLDDFEHVPRNVYDNT